MKIVQFGQQLNTPVVLCLGYFETMHVGHRSLLDWAKKFAAKNNAKIALFTFNRKNKDEVYTFEERIKLYEEAGVDYVIYAEFNKQFAATSGDDFVKKLLSCVDVKMAVCGTDYTFGCDRCGTFKLTFLLGGRTLFIVKPVVNNGVKVSSTQIRSLLKEGKITTVNKLLDRPYFVCGKVCHGRGVGKKLGFPTANIVVSSDKIVPHGVFAGKTIIDGQSYPVIVNIGGKPTFGIDETTVEVHIVGFVGDLYDKEITVEITDFIRNITRFDTQLQLEQQLSKDVEFAKKNFAKQGENNRDQIRS